MKWFLVIFLVLLTEQEINGTTLPKKDASSLKNVTQEETHPAVLEDMHEEKQQAGDLHGKQSWRYCIKEDMRLL